MPTKRITVSVPVEVAARIKRAAAGRRSVSEWVTAAVTQQLEADDSRRRFLEFCDATSATAGEQARAIASFERITGRRGTTTRRQTRARRHGEKAA